MVTAFLRIPVEYDPALADAEGIASAADTLLETALSMPGLLDNFGNPRFGSFLIAAESPNGKDPAKRFGRLAWQRTRDLFSKLGGKYIGSLRRRFRKDVTRTAKYLLFDLEAVELATTTVYDTFEKAKQDSAELDTVIAIPLIFEVE